MEHYSEIFKALADPTRLRILHLFVNGPTKQLCVCELVDTLEIPQYNISRHLKVLRHANLLTEEKCGRWVYYSLRKKRGFLQQLHLTIRQISPSLVQKDLRELKKRLKIREGGKCRKGIQKRHLMP